jgi:5-methylcytosine-specific restriction endonuclease McrA
MPDEIPYLDDRPADYQATEEERERKRFYASVRWRKVRKWFLAKNPLCVHCQAKGRFTAATTVHHLVERLVDPSLAFKVENLEALCSSCHTKHHNKIRWNPDQSSTRSLPRQETPTPNRDPATR